MDYIAEWRANSKKRVAQMKWEEDKELRKGEGENNTDRGLKEYTKRE